MLHRNYALLMLVALIIFSPQASMSALAEETVNESVYENIKEENKEPADNTSLENNQEVEPIVQDDALSVSAFDFIKMFLALAFVLFLVYFLLKFVSKRNRMFQQGQSIVNLGGTSLGQSKSIQIVKVGNRLFVVGVGESISLLKEIDDEKERKQLIEDFERKQEQIVEPKDFIQKVTTILNDNLKRNRAKENESTFSTSFKDQLEKVKNDRTKQLDDVKRKGLNKHE
ncbi:flagellar biosynthetic protein FliO [Metabacillus bambusae]|uniref:Flagellar protein n=1 Tax=Metabacillus bambusae TaxID=2795218 RepID=A0ABS3MX42_9BACI|nr:flagellar biosynthetic protein FliO [Metabacillus bambusae]MBO1510401.1 flagellar biosynthetic protein FliO [Metabacillus bambusae]